MVYMHTDTKEQQGNNIDLGDRYTGMDLRDKEKIVMVTGASSGLGLELCQYLATAGYKVVAAARNMERLLSLAGRINRSGGGGGGVRAVPVELDVKGREEDLHLAVGNAWKAFGRIDALINNAGIRGTISSSLELSMEEWDTVMATNARGVWVMTKLVCKHMRDAKVKGSVINISSITGRPVAAWTGGVAYNASKAAVDILTRDMAMELGKYNIRVNSIAPGLFESGITKGLMKKNWLDNVANRIVPLKTLGMLDPMVTSIVRYLLEDSSEYVTGNVFVADAGTLLPGVPLFSSL